MTRTLIRYGSDGDHRCDDCHTRLGWRAGGEPTRWALVRKTSIEVTVCPPSDGEACFDRMTALDAS